MSSSAPVQPDAARDEQLAELLAHLTEQLRRGEPADVDALARQHPHLADELRQLWATAQVADLGRPVPNNPATLSATPQEQSPAAPAPPTRPRNFGDYEVLGELGRGGMGVVYKARQRSLNRVVALKMILRGELASPADLARFRTEAESAARLEHPNIVPVYEVGSCDGQAYFSMKYVEGQTLAVRVAEGPLPPPEAARLVADIARAVHHAHQQGILHRDLKPSNILLSFSRAPQASADSTLARGARLNEWVPHVSDFGLAKRVEGGASLTRTGAILGTPSYMAPEQAAGSRGVIGPASDVYSLGTILYELLTGRPPFRAASPVETLMLVLEQEPVPPRQLNPRVPRALEMICLKCLQKPADLRYATAAGLADDLEAFLRGEPISARPSGIAFFVVNLLRETHQAPILENWGVLWMWHSLVLLILCTATNALDWLHYQSVWPYLGLWVIGLGTWGSIFWALRRRGGPVTFVEREIAHVWMASTVGSISLFGVERLLDLPVLKLSPVLAVLAGMVFLVKAGMLSGWFYVAAAACFFTAVLMALFPQVGLILFGAVSAVCFFYPGLKYYRQRKYGERESPAS